MTTDDFDLALQEMADSMKMYVKLDGVSEQNAQEIVDAACNAAKNAFLPLIESLIDQIPEPEEICPYAAMRRKYEASEYEARMFEERVKRMCEERMYQQAEQEN